MIESLPSDAFDLPRVIAPDDAEDQRLVRETRGGSDDAFRALVERHQKPIHRFCFHYLRNAEDALEATQDTFVSAHRALDRYQPRARFSTWLFQIALNQCRDRLRRVRSSPAVEQDATCPRPQPDQAAIHEADLAKLDRGLAALREKDRAILVLRCLDGLSQDECAAILKCSERAIEGRLYRARQRLARWWALENT